MAAPLGDTALLKEILSYISSIKSDRVPDMQGGFKRRINIITYGIGRVASCAFILHQIGGRLPPISDPLYAIIAFRDRCMHGDRECGVHVPHSARLAS